MSVASPPARDGARQGLDSRETGSRVTAKRTSVRRCARGGFETVAERPPQPAAPQGGHHDRLDRPARRDRADHGRQPHDPRGRRRPGRRRPDRGGGAGPGGARGHPRDRRVRRHRDAGDDRHPPAHVADRDAGVRRGLDPDPVLRLVLPRARQDLPPRGHPRRQPAVGVGVARGRRHDHRRLVARAADRRPRRRRGRRAAGDAGTVRARLRQHPGRAVGVDRRPGRPRLLRAASYRRGRHARLPAGVRRHRRPGVPREGGVRGRPRPRTRGDHARRRLGRDERRRHPAGPRERLRRPGEHLRARGDAEHRLLPADRGFRRLDLGLDGVGAERRVRATRRPGRCASSTSRCRCRWTPASGGAATCSRRCGRRSAPTARASTSRPTSRATPSPRCRSAPSTSSTGRRAAAPTHLVGTTSAGSPPEPRPTSS